jgi:hypothetical protein
MLKWKNRKECLMKTSRMIALFIAVVFLAFSTMAFAAGPGKKPDRVPPKLQSPLLGSEMLWDRPEAFGPVPKSKRNLGKQVCGADSKAIGYHPKAQDEKGKVFPKGGFLCAPK